MAPSIWMPRWLSARSSMITGTAGATRPWTRAAVEVEQTMMLTRRTSRLSAGPSAGQVSIRAMFGRAAAAIECSRVWAVSTSAATTPTRVPARQLGQAMEGLQMRLRQQREHGDPQTVQPALHLREMAEAGDRCGPAIRLVPPPHGGRQVLRSTLSTRTGSCASSSRPKKSSSARAALDEEHLDGRPEGGRARRRPRSGRPPPRHRGSSPSAAARITASFRKPSRRVGDGRGRRAEATNTPLPRRASTCPLRLRSSIARATVFGLMPRKPASSRMLGQRLVSRDSARLDDVLQLLRQLPADRDRATDIDT